MKKVNIIMENCYGIKKLNHVFEFDDKNIILIYASNGTMKTSFAKTLNDIKNPKEQRYNTIPNICILTKEDGSRINQEDIVVTDSEKEVYKAENVQKLLASPELKREYDNVYNKIKLNKEILLGNLTKLSGNKKLVETEIEIFDMFENYGKDLYSILKNIDISNATEQLSNIVYENDFNDKVINILQDKQTRILLKEYIYNYDRLLKTSKIFCDKKINQYNAETIAKALDKNNFYNTKHKIILNMENEVELNNKNTFTKIIEEEKRRILSDPALVLNFRSIERNFSNEQTRNFREFLINNQYIITELIDLEKFKRSVYISYLKSLESEVKDFINIYEENMVKIKDIQEKLKLEETLWEDTIKEFKNRFKDVPYDIKIENRLDAILNEKIPIVKIVFHDGSNIKEFNREEFLVEEIVSKGEARALKLLEFIYLIKSRKKQDTLLILDDIADSYDYKNKYAILEYIYDLSKYGNIKTILLTHNFDFYRLVASRLRIENTKTNKKLFIITNYNGEIRFEPGKYTRNIFKHWKENIESTEINIDVVLGSIAFFRNIFEVVNIETNKEYDNLTAVLHVMPNSRKINLKFLIDIIDRMWTGKVNVVNLQYDNTKPFDDTALLQDLIIDRAKYLINNIEIIGIDVEKKIILSMATRIIAETFMDNNIINKTWIGEENQYNLMLKQYETENPTYQDKIYILRKVNMITPESIHINSFMYEPIIDMTVDELVSIFNDVRIL